EVVVLDGEIVDGADWQVPRAPVPRPAVVPGDDDPGLGADVEQARPDRILADHPADLACRESLGEIPPRLAVVLALVEVRAIVVDLVARGGEIHRARRVG